MTLLHFWVKVNFGPGVDAAPVVLWASILRCQQIHRRPRRGVANPAGRCDGRSNTRRKRRRRSLSAVPRVACGTPCRCRMGRFLKLITTFAVDLANNIARPVLDRRQILAERPRAGAIKRAAGGARAKQPHAAAHDYRSGRHRSKARLTRREIGKAVAVENLRLQRTMETLLFALRLRMVGTPVADPDAMAHQQPHAVKMVKGWPPQSPHGAPLSISIANGSSPVAAKQRPQAWSRTVRSCSLAQASRHSEYRSSDHRAPWSGWQRPSASAKCPLKSICHNSLGSARSNRTCGPGCCAWRSSLPWRRRISVDRAQCWHWPPAMAGQRPGDLASTPGVIARRPDTQHLGHRRILASVPRWARVRTTRAIAKTCAARRSIPLKPFVAGLPA